MLSVVINRRECLSLTALTLPGVAASAEVRRQVFLASPGKGTAVMAFAYPLDREGRRMLSIEQRWSRSDTIDLAFIRTSDDFGQHWSAPREERTGERRPEGMWRKHHRGVWLDPGSGRTLTLWIEGTLPTDDPLEGMRQWRVHYQVPGGRPEIVVHAGKEYDAAHPLPGVWLGKNSAMLGDQTSAPIRYRKEILIPLSVAPLGADGKLANPGGGYTYHDTAILHGRWQGERLEWRMGEVIPGDPLKTSRGLSEGTIVELDGGRLLCVMRGANDKHPEWPSYKWFSISSDGGWRWSKPEPWTDTQGKNFYSPSACSQLLRHSSGRIYWLGNINETNPRGNRPRYPFFLAEVDRQSGLLKRETVRMIDNLQPGEDPLLTLSNFLAREDARTREICVHMTRLLAKSDGWEGDAMLYRVAV